MLSLFKQRSKFAIASALIAVGALFGNAIAVAQAEQENRIAAENGGVGVASAPLRSGHSQAFAHSALGHS